MNRRHAALHEAALGLFERSAGWQVVSELSFNFWGERGVIDLAAWNEEQRALALGELKSEFVDPGELVGTMDRRQRLAMKIAALRGWRPRVVGVWVIAADTRTNRRHLAASRRLLRGAFPADGHAMAQWLRNPVAPIAGLSFLPVPRVVGEGKRVRVTTGRQGSPRPTPDLVRPWHPRDRRALAGGASIRDPGIGTPRARNDRNALLVGVWQGFGRKASIAGGERPREERVAGEAGRVASPRVGDAEVTEW